MGIFGNMKLKRRSTDVLVGVDDNGDPVYLTLYAQGLGAMDDVREVVVEPKPPIKKDSHGQPVAALGLDKKPAKDASGATIYLRDREDPKYQAALESYEQAFSVALILRSLGDQVKPEADPEDFDTPQEYYLACWREMEKAGLDLGAFKALREAAVALAEPMTKDDVERARDNLGVAKKRGQEGKSETA